MNHAIKPIAITKVFALQAEALQKRKSRYTSKIFPADDWQNNPIPPLAEQARIVSILDKFDSLTSSITEGLPREIELRQKQYEYYRDMLLSFPKGEK